MIKVISSTGNSASPIKMQIVEVVGGSSRTMHIHRNRETGNYDHKPNGVFGGGRSFSLDHGVVKRA